MTEKQEDPPNELEALQPVRSCTTSEELRFFNVTAMLNEWAMMAHFRRAMDGRYDAPRFRELSIRLLDHFFHEAEPGERRKPDRDFWSLFPERIPLGYGRAMTKQGLADELIKTFKSRIGLRDQFGDIER